MKRPLSTRAAIAYPASLLVAGVRVQAKAAPTESSHVTALALATREPPVEMQLWNVGANPTDYGVHRWTERSASEVMSAYQARGNPLVIDIEHNEAGVAGSKDVTGPTAGYARLELREGAPWIVFDWSDVAVEQIRTGQRKFISPDYHVNKETGEIVGLSRVSLVANPGTHRARMLANAKDTMKIKAAGIDPSILKKFIDGLNPEDVEQTLSAIQSFVQAHTGDTVADESVDPDGPPPAPVAAEGAPPPKDDKPMPFKKPEEGTPDKPEDKKPEPVAAAAEEPKPVAASASADAPVVDLVARRELDNVRRDGLVRDHASKLTPQIKAWAASQPFGVVKAYIDALPADLDPPTRVTATRGEGQGGSTSPFGRDGFQPGTVEFQQFQAMIGAPKAEPIGPTILPNGTLRINAGSPGQWRSQEAERVRAAGKVK